MVTDPSKPLTHTLLQSAQTYHTQMDALNGSLAQKTAAASGVEALDKLFLSVLTAREAVAKELKTPDIRTQGEAFALIYDADTALYNSADILMRYGVRLGKWRYLLSGESEPLGWWWYLDRHPRRSGNEIVYDEPSTLLFILGILLFTFGVFVVLFTTQRLWAHGLDALGILSFGIQTIVGGGLLTERGQEIASHVVERLNGIPDGFLSFVRKDRSRRLPITDDSQTPRGKRMAAVGAVFLVIVLIIAVIVLPGAARLAHNLGLSAISHDDITSAQTLLTLATQLQPDTLGLSDTSLTVSLWQLANLYESTGDIANARASYEAALRSDAKNVLVHHKLALIYAADGETDRALALLDWAIQLLSDDVAHPEENLLAVDQQAARRLLYLTYLARGEVMYGIGNLGAARLDLREAAQFTQDSPELFDQPGVESVITTELHVYSGRVYYALYVSGDCSETAARDIAIDEWKRVRDMATDRKSSKQIQWAVEASTALSTLANATCPENTTL